MNYVPLTFLRSHNRLGGVMVSVLQNLDILVKAHEVVYKIVKEKK